MVEPRSAERTALASDRLGIRLLGLALEQIRLRSLRKFAELITGDPVLRQALVSCHQGTYHASFVHKVAHTAAQHSTLRAEEQEAVYAAALVSRIPEIALTYALDHNRRNRKGRIDLPALQRRCDYFLASALKRLQTSDPTQACVVMRALGIAHLEQVDHLHSDRLPAVLRDAWASVAVNLPLYQLARAEKIDSSDCPSPIWTVL